MYCRQAMITSHQNRIEQLRESFQNKIFEAEKWPEKVDIDFSNIKVTHNISNSDLILYGKLTKIKLCFLCFLWSLCVFCIICENTILIKSEPSINLTQSEVLPYQFQCFYLSKPNSGPSWSSEQILQLKSALLYTRSLEWGLYCNHLVCLSVTLFYNNLLACIGRNA